MNEVVCVNGGEYTLGRGQGTAGVRIPKTDGVNVFWIDFASRFK